MDSNTQAASPNDDEPLRLESGEAEPITAGQAQVDVAEGADHHPLLLILGQPAGRGGDNHLF